MSTQRAVKTQEPIPGAARRADKTRSSTANFDGQDEAFDGFDDEGAIDDDEDGDDFEKAADDGSEGAKQFRDDPVLDRRIIEGMLKDRNTFLDEMAAEGFGQAAVLRRAAELGLSEALIRQVKGVAADLAGERPGRRPAPSSLGARTCLSCDRVFLSSGPGNRLCMRCRGGDAGLAQL